MNSEFINSLKPIWMIPVVSLLLTYLMLSFIRWRERVRKEQPTPADERLIAKETYFKAGWRLPNALPPEHSYFGLWQHLFHYRNFTENELQQIVGHCDRILLAKEHQDAVMEWERTMMELVGEDAPASVTKAIEEIKRKRDEYKRQSDQYFKTSVAWSDLMQKHFGTMVLGDADKAIRSMLEMEAKHNDELKRANERADHNRREMVQQSATATALRQERDDWKAVSEGLQTEYDSMKKDRDDWKGRADRWSEECKNWENTYNTACYEIQRLESELSRGNETITWMKADLSTAYAIIKEHEDVLASLGIKEPRRRDENGRFAPKAEPTAIERMHEAVEKYKESGVMFMPASEMLPSPRPDHPCLKGCIAPLGGHCKCPESAPKDGKFRVVHPREFFEENLVLPKRPLFWRREQALLKEWAEPRGMEIRVRSGYSPADGVVKYEYIFSRPAVNSDFDASNTKA